MGIHAQFALANRREIEAEIERLIGLLDAADAPLADLEPEEDYGAEDCNEGEGDWGRGLLPILPQYGIDQSAGPVNEREGYRAHHARMMAG